MPDSVEENAALIAEHLKRPANWQPHTDGACARRAWSATRDVDAALSEVATAKRIADMLAADGSDQLSLRIPHSRCCAPAWQARAVHESQGHFHRVA